MSEPIGSNETAEGERPSDAAADSTTADSTDTALSGSSKEHPEADPSGNSRRSFMSVATIALGGVISLATAVPLLRYFFHPAGKKIVSGSGASIDAIAASELVAGAHPVKVTLVGSQVRDAWNVVDSVNLGAAWVRKDEDGTVSAFTSVCPHLGCAIDYDADAKNFKCPCHRSAFEIDGSRIKGPSKRGLDPLPVVVNDGRVQITHKRFVTEIAERVEKA